MILDLVKIAEILKKNPHEAAMSSAREYNRKMRMHMYGEKMSSYLTTIDGFEKPALTQLRTKYAKSNKDLFSRLSRPIDKVFSARGGSIYYNLPEAQEKKAVQLASNLRNGMSVKEWIENVWKAHYLDDPNGIILMEIYPSDVAAQMQQQGKSVTYPTYKSIQSIYTYHSNGAELDYLFLHTSKLEKESVGLQESDIVYRLIDDEKDCYVKLSGEVVTIHDQLPNIFMKVPAMINSDFISSAHPGIMVSLFDDVIELADEFILKGSIKSTHDFMHAFPKYWEYADDCSACGGTGLYDSKKCETCRGTGKNIMTKVSDAKLITWPDTKDAPVITPNVAGYVEPSEIFHRIANETIVALEGLMRHTTWGVQDSVKQPGITDATKTATQIVSDIKPEADRLMVISKAAEKRNKFIIDSVVKININQSYSGASVNYGKRFMIEGPDVLWEKYQDAKTKGVAYSILDDMLIEYYEAKYSGDAVKLHIQSKLVKVEPFVHMSIMQVKGFGVSDDVYKEKLYFGEWLSTVTDSVLLISTTEQLREMLSEYCDEVDIADKPETADKPDRVNV